MPKFSKKVMGKEVGDASVYAAPHDMKGKTTAKSGRPVPSGEKTTPTRVNGSQPSTTDSYESSVVKPGRNGINEINISVAGISKGNGKPVNQYGKMEMRGAGAATKGRMTSGKMG
jgi:hypothetical protein